MTKTELQLKTTVCIDLMPTRNWLVALGAAAFLAIAPETFAQARPYIGYAYPAGGQHGTTIQVKLGGQGLDGVDQVLVTGSGVSAKVVDYQRSLNPQETTLLREQLTDLRRGKSKVASRSKDAETAMMASDSTMMMDSAADSAKPENGAAARNAEERKLTARIEKRLAETVNRPASASLANIVYVEVTIAPDAPVGERELRLGTARGISNPLVFHVGQFPEVSRKAMITAPLQVLGKEETALRKRPANEVESRIELPCTVNGQIASGERNRYRFNARKGQNLVITAEARQLVPYIADAVPGWFQPILVLYTSEGKEIAYNDDFRFKPDPTIFFKVPAEGEYVLEVFDSIFRGREDFVYRITLGEVPFLTSLFPLGGRAGSPATIRPAGWNLTKATLTSPDTNAAPGIYRLTAKRGNLISNPLPFQIDTLPETLDREANDAPSQAQKVQLPIIVNGRMNRPGDWDVFRFAGKSNQTVVVEVSARRLESPLDSIIKLVDAQGHLLAVNDDLEDPTAGINTHHADSYLTASLPADGPYFVHIGDTAQNGGEEYAYRLRISAPRPDFDLRVVPSSVALRNRSSASLSVHVIRRDGFTGPIKLALKNPSKGFYANPVSLTGTQTVTRITIRTDLRSTAKPVPLTIAGTARIMGQDVTHDAVPSEDRMQAFLWRHLVPAADFQALVYDQNAQLPARRIRRVQPAPPQEPKPVLASANATDNKPKFSKQQVAGRLRQLKLLFDEGLLTEEFFDEKVAECEAAQ